MTINLGEAEKQKEVGIGPIPKGSMVKVKVEIRKPKKADKQDPAVTVFSTKVKGLDCVFSVVSGQYENVKIWENIFLPPQMQEVKLTTGQEGACNGGFAKVRAIIEAARRIDPEDLNQDRNIQSWFDIHGLEVPVKVGIAKIKPGDQYINNTILKVLSVADEEFDQVMGGGEIITDVPIPEIPAAQTTTTTQQPSGQWGKADTSKTETKPPEQTQQHQQKVAVPDWANQK